MLRDLWRFMAERMPLAIALPLASVLWLGAPWHRQSLAQALTGILATACALLALRMADDLNSLPEDRQKKPERLLCQGHIEPAHLWRWVGLLCLVLCLLAFGAFIVSHDATLWLLVPGLLWYAGYFRFKHRLPLLLRPFFSNGVFLFLPLIHATGTPLAALWLGLFCYLAAIGHEFAHNVRRRDEGQAGKGPDGDYTDLLGPRGTVALAAGLYGLSWLAALAYYLGLPAGHGVVFVATLQIMTLLLLFLFVRIWRDPCLQQAKRFYVAGFLFFLLPLLLDVLYSMLPLSTLFS